MVDKAWVTRLSLVGIVNKRCNDDSKNFGNVNVATAHAIFFGQSCITGENVFSDEKTGSTGT